MLTSCSWLWRGLRSPIYLNQLWAACLLHEESQTVCYPCFRLVVICWKAEAFGVGCRHVSNSFHLQRFRRNWQHFRASLKPEGNWWWWIHTSFSSSETALVAVIQEVLHCSEWSGELSREYSFPGDLSWNPEILDVFALCSMILLPLELRTECFSWTIRWRHEEWIWKYLSMWQNIILITTRHKRVYWAVFLLWHWTLENLRPFTEFLHGLTNMDT